MMSACGISAFLKPSIRMVGSRLERMCISRSSAIWLPSTLYLAAIQQVQLSRSAEHERTYSKVCRCGSSSVMVGLIYWM